MGRDAWLLAFIGSRLRSEPSTIHGLIGGSGLDQITTWDEGSTGGVSFHCHGFHCGAVCRYAGSSDILWD